MHLVSTSRSCFFRYKCSNGSTIAMSWTLWVYCSIKIIKCAFLLVRLDLSRPVSGDQDRESSFRLHCRWYAEKSHSWFIDSINVARTSTLCERHRCRHGNRWEEHPRSPSSSCPRNTFTRAISSIVIWIVPTVSSSPTDKWSWPILVCRELISKMMTKQRWARWTIVLRFDEISVARVRPSPPMAISSLFDRKRVDNCFETVNGKRITQQCF